MLIGSDPKQGKAINVTKCTYLHRLTDYKRHNKTNKKKEAAIADKNTKLKNNSSSSSYK